MRYLLIVSFFFFAIKRLLTYLHIFQQDEYDGKRFVRWMWAKKAFDRKLSACLIIVALLNPVLSQFLPFGPLFILFFVGVAFKELDPRYLAKKKLVLTARASRVYAVALLLAAIMGSLTCFVCSPWIWLLPVHLLPFTLIVANIMLIPVEARIQKHYWNEAHDKLLSLNPFIIGITGSFGKTSVKHILGHILEITAPTLITPGSVNTPMGIARIVRERLTPQHKYFIAEMGAYGPGSIERLCRLAPPKMGIVTAIGHAHYERFKSLDTVAKAKFELAQAAVSVNGKVIVHEEVLNFDYTKGFYQQHKENFVVCGREQSSFFIKSMTQEAGGLRVELSWQGRDFLLEAPLYGLHHGANMALAFAAACELGIAPETAITALKSTPQIEHRLQVKPQGNDVTLIDDAYNSNPKGFLAALELLPKLKKEGGRIILVTPGMVELGAVHDQEHARIGQTAAAVVDVLVAVAPQRIESLVNAFEKNATKEKSVIRCDSFAQAREWLAQNTLARDVILLENDLPDLTEATLRL